MPNTIEPFAIGEHISGTIEKNEDAENGVKNLRNITIKATDTTGDEITITLYDNWGQMTVGVKNNTTGREVKIENEDSRMIISYPIDKEVP